MIVFFQHTEGDKLNQMVFGAGGQRGEGRWGRRKGEAKESRPSSLELPSALFTFEQEYRLSSEYKLLW